MTGSGSLGKVVVGVVDAGVVDAGLVVELAGDRLDVGALVDVVDVDPGREVVVVPPSDADDDLLVGPESVDVLAHPTSNAPTAARTAQPCRRMDLIVLN